MLGHRRCELKAWPIMDPHAIIRFLFNDAGITVPPWQVQAYWRVSRFNQEPWAVHSQASEHHIPLGLFGDSATLITKYGLKTSVIGIFLSLPLWRPKSVRMSRYLVLAIPEACLWGRHTLNEAFRRIVWSINSLDKNIHPDVGFAGQELPEHLKKLANTPIVSPHRVFSCTEIRGDWSWHKKLLGFKASWVGDATCYQCNARSGGPNNGRYYAFETGLWIDQSLSLPEFLCRQIPPQKISH